MALVTCVLSFLNWRSTVEPMGQDFVMEDEYEASIAYIEHWKYGSLNRSLPWCWHWIVTMKISSNKETRFQDSPKRWVSKYPIAALWKSRQARLKDLSKPDSNKYTTTKRHQTPWQSLSTQFGPRSPSQRPLDIRTPPGRTKHNFEARPGRYRKRTRRIIIRITIRIRTNRLRSLTVIICFASLCGIVLSSTAMLWFMSFAAEGETWVKWKTSIAYFFHWCELKVPRAPVGDVCIGHLWFKRQWRRRVCAVEDVLTVVVGIEVLVWVEALQTSCADEICFVCWWHCCSVCWNDLNRHWQIVTIDKWDIIERLICMG